MTLRRALPDALLMALLGLAVVALVAGAAHAPGFRLSPDSTLYLTVARNLVEGHGLTEPQVAGGRFGLAPLSIWPPGYPWLIAMVARATGLPVYWSSKVLGAGLLAGGVLLVRRHFGAAGRVAALPFLFATTLDIFGFTWSEGPFIIAMTAFAIALARYGARPSLTGAAAVGASAAAMFLFRYVGAFAIVLAGLIALADLWRRGVRQAWPLLAASGLAVLTAGAWLVRNVVMTGFATGMPRPPAIETSLDLLRQLAAAAVRELALPVAGDGMPLVQVIVLVAAQVILLAVLTHVARRWRSHPADAAQATGAASFIAVGCAYLAAIVILRFRSAFDPFDFRLLHPGVLLVMIGVLAWSSGRKDLLARGNVLLAIAMAAASTGLLAARCVANRNAPSYAAETARLLAESRVVPAGSAIVFGPDALRFRRTDLLVLTPEGPPDRPTLQTIDEVRAELGPGARLFIDRTNPAADGYVPADRMIDMGKGRYAAVAD